MDADADSIGHRGKSFDQVGPMTSSRAMRAALCMLFRRPKDAFEREHPEFCHDDAASDRVACGERRRERWTVTCDNVLVEAKDVLPKRTGRHPLNAGRGAGIEGMPMLADWDAVGLHDVAVERDQTDLSPQPAPA